MNEQMNEWMNAWMNAWMNWSFYEQYAGLMNEWTDIKAKTLKKVKFLVIFGHFTYFGAPKWAPWGAPKLYSCTPPLDEGIFT